MKKKNTKRNAVHRRNVGDQSKFVNEIMEKTYENNPKKSPFGNTKTSRHTKGKSLKRENQRMGTYYFGFWDYFSLGYYQFVIFKYFKILQSKFNQKNKIYLKYVKSSSGPIVSNVSYINFITFSTSSLLTNSTVVCIYLNGNEINAEATPPLL